MLKRRSRIPSNSAYRLLPHPVFTMSDTVISVENISKAYRLGQIGGGTLREDFARWWARLCRKPDPYLKIGQEHHARKIGEQFWALDDVSFQVKQGEVMGIIGRNGAGKSTLLKILSQVTTPTSGQIKVKGRIASLLEVGTGFHPELTGRENVFLNGAILGMTKAEIRKKFDEIVAFSEIEDFIDTPVKRYSSGMYVRLAFAVAAHLEPEILICDEVLAVGDAEFQKKCLGKMQDVSQREGRTVLFVSHNLGVVRNLCQDACWFDAGKIKKIGSSIEITEAFLRQGVASVGRVVHLGPMERTHNFGQLLRLDKLEWGSEPPLVHDGGMSASITFKAMANIDDLSVSIGFSNFEGTRLVTYESDLFGPRQRISKGNSGVCTFRADALPLAPGNYVVDIGARSGDLHGVDFLAGFTQIEVVPNRRTPGNLLATGASVRIPSEWQWDI
jgi:lipopolysaccharide transport system ATP-binding protein